MNLFLSGLIVLCDNEEEITANFSYLSSVSALVSDGDRIAFDITHAFRSLAFYELLTVNYYKKISGKKVEIDFVAYGMFEYSQENNGITPITDQSKLLELMDWTNAAEEYKRFGTTYLLCDLLKNEKLEISLTKEELKAVQRLGDSVIVNDYGEFANLVKFCERISRRAVEEHISNPAMFYIFEDINQRFGNIQNDIMLLSAELAKWHYEKKRYINAAITIIEAMLTYCSELTGLPSDTIRERISSSSSTNCIAGNFIKKYNEVRLLRNSLCHGKPLSKEAVLKLKEHITGFGTIYKNHFMSNPDNRNALTATFRR